MNCSTLASYFGMTPLQMKVVETAIVKKKCAHNTQYKQNRSRSESAQRQISTFILSKLKLSKLQAVRVVDCVNGICEKGGFDCLGKLNITL